MNQKEISEKIEDDEKEDTLSSLEDENHNKDVFIKPTSYTIKYTRSKNELSELVLDTKLPKAKYCQFMIEFVLIKNNESFLRIKCHEISAIHFEDFYERIYSYNDIIQENKYFRALDTIEEIKDSIDYVLSQNKKNSKRIFIKLENNTLKLHIYLTYFDNMKEIILNIPKKKLRDEEKIFLLPMLLKEVQEKMKVYEKENKKYKIKKKKMTVNKTKNIDEFNYFTFDLINEKEKQTEDDNNKSLPQSVKNETNDTSNNNSLEMEENKIKIRKDVSVKKKKKKKIEGKIKVKDLEKKKNGNKKIESNYF